MSYEFEVYFTRSLLESLPVNSVDLLGDISLSHCKLVENPK